MSPFQDMTRAVTVRYNDKVKKFCSPLFDYFNLNQFYYVKITNDGCLYSVDSHPMFAEYWAAEYCDKYSLYRHPKFFRSEVSVITQSQDKNLGDMISTLQVLFNFQTWLRIVDKVEDGIEEFGFSSPTASPILGAGLMNEIPLFRLFMKKFREEHKQVFSKLDDFQVDIARIVGADFYKNDLPEMPKVLERRNLLRSLGIEFEDKLTPREIRALKLLLDGYSAGKIALKTFVSRRTVEHLMERLKEKLCCFSKAELVQKARELERLGLF
ncbi:MAG: helix-turn-helix transcriptional regulator [Parachlamydiales bacterium]|nr:helix-turn-helix transcriptional regulator [Parachlamydiales bacterium]